MLTPTEADFKGPLRRPTSSSISQPDNMAAKDRVKALPPGVGTSPAPPSASRQVLYERFFASDPLTRGARDRLDLPEERGDVTASSNSSGGDDDAP